MFLQLNVPDKLEVSEITVEGKDYFLVPKGAIEGLYRPSGDSAPAAVPVAVKAAAPAVTRPAPDGKKESNSPIQDAIRAMLLVKPMESGELVYELRNRTSADTVYVTLGLLRKRNLIATKEDEAGGRKKNFWVGERA